MTNQHEKKAQFYETLIGTWKASFKKKGKIHLAEVIFKKGNEVQLTFGSKKETSVLYGKCDIKDSLLIGLQGGTGQSYAVDCRIRKIDILISNKTISKDMTDLKYKFHSQIVLTRANKLYFPLPEHNNNKGNGKTPEERLLVSDQCLLFSRIHNTKSLANNSIIDAINAESPEIEILNLAGIPYEKEKLELEQDNIMTLLLDTPPTIESIKFKEACDEFVNYNIIHYNRFYGESGFSINQSGNNKQYRGVGCTYERLSRFFWIHSLLYEPEFENEVSSPLQHWYTKEKIETAYQNEKDRLNSDPGLHLYWLLHFGLLHDTRYEELKKTISDHQFLQDAVGLIKSLRNQNIAYQGITANLLTRYNKFINSSGLPSNYQVVLHSLLNDDGHPGSKAYWIVENANRDKAWKSLHQELMDADLSKQGMAYIQANNPMLSKVEQKQYASRYLEELNEFHKQYYKDKASAFSSLYTIYLKVDDLDLVAKITGYYGKYIKSSFDPSVIDGYNEIVQYLRNKNNNIIEFYLPKQEIYLEKFDELGYKQLEVRRFSDQVLAIYTLNEEYERVQRVWHYSDESVEHAYKRFVTYYLSDDFQEVSKFGQLAENVPESERPIIISKRLNYHELLEQYPHLKFDDVWWKDSVIDVYEDNIVIEETIDLNTADVFEQSVGKVFLKNLTVKGGIENREGDFGNPILVLGNTKADSIVAGGAYLEFKGDVILNDLLVMFYNHGHLEMGKSLRARAVFVDNDHSYGSPDWTQADFYFDDDATKNDKRRKAKHYLTKDILAEMFPDAEWIDKEEYEGDDGTKNYEYYFSILSFGEDTEDFAEFCDQLIKNYKKRETNLD